MSGRAGAYSPSAIGLHWLAALIIVADFALGLYFIDLPLSPGKLRLFSWHKWAGAMVLPVAALLLAWRVTHTAQPLPAAMPRWESISSRYAHVLLYIFLFAAPLSGWLYSSAAGFQTVIFGVLPIPDVIGRDPGLAAILKTAHRWINYTFAAVIVLHAVAALKHHLVDRDDILTRMIPLLRKS